LRIYFYPQILDQFPPKKQHIDLLWVLWTICT
jgi:hypothetical protein